METDRGMATATVNKQKIAARPCVWIQHELAAGMNKGILGVDEAKMLSTRGVEGKWRVLGARNRRR